ncbi:protein shisa-7 [Chanos chanos]|uniref:Protein shisa-7 n=1 Tax=Chanos chanos TaxID=29144 RepID=A0A6J2W7N8_CHACN|nr:protein shisa-7-like [Chanos chanos]
MASSVLRVGVIFLLLVILIPLPPTSSAASVTPPPTPWRQATRSPTTSPRQQGGALLPGPKGRSGGRKNVPIGRPKPYQPARGLETPPRPLAQVMGPNDTANALKPPHGAAQAPPSPGRLVEVDVCRGYYDVMGHYDLTFNCSKDNFIYCCGTCQYRFCCPDRTRRLDQNICQNYISPVWANTAPPGTRTPPPFADPGLSRIEQSNNTVYVIGGVISFTVAVAVAIKVAFHKASRQPRNRELNMPRALVDMLRHQSSPVQQGERNNSVALATTTGEGTLGRPPKNLYPTLQSKDNRLGNLQHNFIHTSGSSPKHTATIERTPRMNNMQIAPGGTLKPSKHTNAMKPQPSFHHSLHNLAQLPPSYEAAVKPEMNRYSSLKRLEKGGLEEYSGYCTTKRRPNNAPPSFHSSQHHLHWGGDYTLGGRGTLPNRPRIPHPQSAPSHTPNPYPLEPTDSQRNQTGYDTLSKPPRRVKSTDQLLALGDGNTLSRLSKNQQHQYYKAMAAATAKNSNAQNTLRKSRERLLMSPDHLEEQVGGGSSMGVVDYGGGGGGPGMGMSDYGSSSSGIGSMGMGVGVGVPTLPRHQKAQSQQNVCTTPSLDRHHMIKMNSHPTSGREQERNAGHLGGGGVGGMGWGDMPGTGVVMGTGTLGGHSARRLAFAAKRQNTIEQLHFIPGGGGTGGGGGVGGNQGVRTGSKNEVTV